MPDHMKPGVDWAAAPDGSLFYAADVLDWGYVYGRLNWTEPGRAAVTIYGKTFEGGVDGYLDASAMTRLVTPHELAAAEDLDFPPLEEVMRFLRHEAGA